MTSFSTHDREMMARALKAARKARYTVSPNPAVGCVISRDGNVIGEGFTCPPGGNHAEVEALAMAGNAENGHVYVTLEPCNHQGKTGPCTQALIDAGVTRVVIACEDPNPAVSGSGIKALKDAGLVVDVGLFEDQARQINRGFIKRHEQGIPWILIKMAASIDGRTAMASGHSQWVTTPAARKDVQKLRAASCAIVTGSGTQLMDDPSLTVRLSESELGIIGPVRQPLRVVVDSQLRIQPSARIFQQSAPVLVAAIEGQEQRERSTALVKAGAEVVFLPVADGHVDLHALIQKLSDRECNQVMIEAGAGLAGAFIGEGLVDELVCYWAPKLFGSQARPMFDLQINTIDAHLALAVKDVRRIGEDIRMIFSPDKDY